MIYAEFSQEDLRADMEERAIENGMTPEDAARMAEDGAREGYAAFKLDQIMQETINSRILGGFKRGGGGS